MSNPYAEEVYRDVVAGAKLPKFYNVPQGMDAPLLAKSIRYRIWRRTRRSVGVTIVDDQLCVFNRANPFEFRKPTEKRRWKEANE